MTMFKIPDWGEDVPKSNIDLKKLLPSKNKSKAKHSKIQANDVLKNNFKAKDRAKPIINGKIAKLKNSRNKNVENKILVEKCVPKIVNVQKKTEAEPLNHIDIKNYDTDMLDEVILDARKKKLIDLCKKEDNEETLFTEDFETNVKRTNTSVNTNKINGSIKASPGNIRNNDIINKINQKKQLMQANLNSSNKMELINKRNSNTNYSERDLITEIKECKNKQKKPHKLSLTEINTNEICNDNIKHIEQENENNKELNTINNSVNVKDSKIMGTTLINAKNKTNIKNNRKKELLKIMLQNHKINTNVDSGNKLRERMLEKLNAAKFRFLNEKLYTSSGTEAQKLFKEDPVAFQTYHQGYQQQVKKWPVNPLDIVVRRIKSMPKTHLIADMGCGEAALSKRVPQTVRSFDLVATAPGVEVCDMAHTPLLSDSVNVAVYCLALMGTDLTQYLIEANRVLKMGGHLLIAEVESRFDDVDSFSKEVQKLGFTLRKLDESHKVFYFMEFTKAREAPRKKSKLPALYLKPCIYKRR